MEAEVLEWSLYFGKRKDESGRKTGHYHSICLAFEGNIINRYTNLLIRIINDILIVNNIRILTIAFVEVTH